MPSASAWTSDSTSQSRSGWSTRRCSSRSASTRLRPELHLAQRVAELLGQHGLGAVGNHAPGPGRSRVPASTEIASRSSASGSSRVDGRRRCSRGPRHERPRGDQARLRVTVTPSATPRAPPRARPSTTPSAVPPRRVSTRVARYSSTVTLRVSPAAARRWRATSAGVGSRSAGRPLQASASRSEQPGHQRRLQLAGGSRRGPSPASPSNSATRALTGSWRRMRTAATTSARPVAASSRTRATAGSRLAPWRRDGRSGGGGRGGGGHSSPTGRGAGSRTGRAATEHDGVGQQQHAGQAEQRCRGSRG